MLEYRAKGHQNTELNTRRGQKTELNIIGVVSVLDLVTQFRDVVFVRCIFSSGKPQGVGILERGVYGVEWGNGEISLRATWERGGRDPITARRVPSK